MECPAGYRSAQVGMVWREWNFVRGKIIRPGGTIKNSI